MRTTRRLAVVSAVLGGGLLLAGPATAQPAVDCDKYPDLAECQEIDEDLGGNEGGGATGVDDEDDTAGSGSQGTSNAASLPVTGGEVTLIALAGTAALGGGVALTAAGRKRSKA